MRENGRRGKWDPEYELLDTGTFDDDRYWIVEVHYAKADPHDLLMSIQVTNAGPDAATLHVLPSAWFRNTWSWDADAPRPQLAATGGASVATTHPFLGDLELVGGARTGRHRPDPAVLRQRDEPAPPLRPDDRPPVSQGRDQRPCRRRGAHHQPGADRHQVRLLVSW